jgi:hypothetical protein
MSDRPCARDFDGNLIQFEQFGDGISEGVNTIRWLAEAGKAGRFVHCLLEGFPQWTTLTALEDALIDNDACDGFTFVVGTIAADPEVRGWLEHGDFIIVPYGDKRKSTGSDVGVWFREDFDAMDYTVQAVAPAGPESGILLNAQMKSLGHGLLGEP